MIPHANNLNKNFIGAWYNKYSADICNDIILKYKRTLQTLKHDYTQSELGNTRLNCKDIKSEDLIAIITGIISPALEDYFKLYPASTEVHPFDLLTTSMRIDHWAPGKGNNSWYHEKDGKLFHENKHLAFTLFLNDVNVEGEEEFLHQEVSFKPQAGLIVIWPTAWTHSHRTQIAPNDDKYTLSGYVTFEDERK